MEWRISRASGLLALGLVVTLILAPAYGLAGTLTSIP